jgi:uncharacterized protein with HEPN domain
MEAIVRFGNSFEVLEKDDVYRDGMAMRVYQISELAQHLTADFTLSYGNMPWHLIKGLRVVFAHRYGTLDKKILWKTISERVPELKKFCTEILAKAAVSALSPRDKADTPSDDSPSRSVKPGKQ